MKLRFALARSLAIAFAAALAASSLAPIASADPGMGQGMNQGGQDAAASDANYDRLDGTGASGKKVQVIEWEGNLEIHVYPKGSIAGIGLKLDNRNQDRPVMVIAYRFVENPQQTLVRRNILGIPMYDGFKVYKDPMENDFDKFIISNNGLSGDVVSFKLDPPPTQLYPDGSPMLAGGGQGSASGRAPASVGGSNGGYGGYATPAGGTGYTAGPQPSRPDDAGTIQPFFMNQGGRGGR